MTLAVILISIFLTASVSPAQAPAVGQDAQQAPAGKPATVNSTGSQGSSPSQNTPAASKPNPAKTPSAQKPPVPRRPLHMKKPGISDCNPAPAAAPDSTNPASTSSASPGSASPSSGATLPAARSATASTDCPPSKVIVRQGGASEPAIPLAGGQGGNQATQQRNTANQMLAVADRNLKKIAGQTLTANQQDMVNQIHQFIEQSKTATAAGDLDRAGTLAWKAQLLSEELVKPQK